LEKKQAKLQTGLFSLIYFHYQLIDVASGKIIVKSLKI